MITNHTICLMGCDDSTEFEMEMTDSQLIFLKEVAKKANKTSTYDCMPTMYIDGKRIGKELIG